MPWYSILALGPRLEPGCPNEEGANPLGHAARRTERLTRPKGRAGTGERAPGIVSNASVTPQWGPGFLEPSGRYGMMLGGLSGGQADQEANGIASRQGQAPLYPIATPTAARIPPPIPWDPGVRPHRGGDRLPGGGPLAGQALVAELALDPELEAAPCCWI